MKRLLSWLVPYSLWVKLRILWLARKKRREQLPQGPASAAKVDYQFLMKELISYGLDESQLREGSMPEESLKAMAALLEQHFKSAPIIGLHVGNFVGVSLTYLTSALVHRNSQSRMVSIDPNLPHRGIDRPMEKVIRLLNRAGVQGNSLILTGYSLQKSVSNDGFHYTEAYDPKATFTNELSCEKQLQSLAALCGEKFQFVVLDGNHEGDYLKDEMTWVDQLLVPGGLIMLDDVCETWIEIQEVFRRLSEAGAYEKIYEDGRIGVLQKKS